MCLGNTKTVIYTSHPTRRYPNPLRPSTHSTTLLDGPNMFTQPTAITPAVLTVVKSLAKVQRVPEHHMDVS